MQPYIMIFSRDEAEQAITFSNGPVFYVPDDDAYFVRGKEQNIPLVEGDVLIKFENPDNSEDVDFYLIGKENFLISEEEKKEHDSQ